MCRSSWKWLFVMVFVAASLMTVATDAKAYWGCCGGGGWGGWGWGGWGSYGGWSSGWYGGCGWGCHHRRCSGYWGGWGYGCGCGYSSCCGWSSCSYDLCCGGVGTAVPSTYAPGATTPAPAKRTPVQPSPAPNEPTPAIPAELTTPMIPPVTPGAPATPGEPALPGGTVPVPGGLTPPPGTSETPTQSNSGLLTVWVPYNAKVTVNGMETRSTGSKRQFVSYGLKPGFSYKYEVRAEAVRNGQLETETRSVVLTAGERTSVAFGFNPKAKEADVALSR